MATIHRRTVITEAFLRQMLLDLDRRRRLERMLQESMLERPGGLP